MSSSLEDELDRLFQLPLGEFVSARNHLAAALKKDGNSEASKRVKELPKPTPSAWAVNQLYWRARPVLTSLLSAGDAYRDAQQAALSGAGTDRLAEAERSRGEAIDVAVRQLRQLLEEGGLSSSPGVWQRVRATLDSLASYGNTNPRPMNGRLASDLDSPGFAALAPLAPAPPRLERERAADRDDRKRIRAEIEGARRDLDDAEGALAQARAELERARTRVLDSEERVDAFRRRWEALSAEGESGEAVGERK